ncbi:unnamed protein product [Somion occarium]|uniref:DNA endonuclease activator Ctp1 C-terminal domain-containing protein n=1 Tax=Somion occarium TaxID=3059160 RepID=A0ABP1D9X1_9APHY
MNASSAGVCEVDRLRNELKHQLQLNRLTRGEIDPIVQALDDVKRENARLMRALEEARSDNIRLKKMLQRAAGSGGASLRVGEIKENPIVVADQDSNIEDAERELRLLRQQYNDLLHEKEQATRRYQEHYRKWRNFKKWLANEEEARSPNASKGMATPSPSRLLKVRRILEQSTNDAEDENANLFINSHHSPPRVPLKLSPEHSNALPFPLQDSPLHSQADLEDPPAVFPSHKPRRLSSPPIANKMAITESPEFINSRQYRKQLHASDCECCHDYYEAIGPLPPRLMPPPWRTPTKPKLDKVNSQERSIQQHKHQISRHRNQWKIPQTPPGYWNIGFPDTQEAEIINKQKTCFYAWQLRLGT